MLRGERQAKYRLVINQINYSFRFESGTGSQFNFNYGVKERRAVKDCVFSSVEIISLFDSRERPATPRKGQDMGPCQHEAALRRI